MRISREQMFMEMAHVVAKRSTCMRLNVGAVIIRGNRVVSIGYNGVAPGEPHCRGDECPGKQGCHLTIHAEINAFNYLPEDTEPDAIFVTHSPCKSCWDFLSPRIPFWFIGAEYRETSHLPKDSKRIFRVTPAGFIIDWGTGHLVKA